MKISFLTFFATSLLLFASCSSSQTPSPSLQEELYAIVDTVPGTVGIACISGTDTVTVNNGVHYPMMSVFKMHEALAVAHSLQENGSSIDTLLHLRRSDLDMNTWSPMLKEYTYEEFDIPVYKLMKYAIVSSDNNASNLLFRHIVSPKETDAFIRSIAEDTSFQICHSEAEMKDNHSLSYLNYTSPKAAALLIRQIFQNELVEKEMQDSIRQYLTAVVTGQDRLGAAVQDNDIKIFAHKTGSGFRNENGELIAHNDVGYFSFPDGRSYSLAVFIRDFNGNEEEASRIIANISKCVYKHFSAFQ